MLFNSFEFAIFFPVVCAIYFALPHRMRTLWLLVSSCVFYMSFIPVYILILGLTIAIDYVAGIYLEKTTGRTRTLILWNSIIVTCLVLFVFKYFNFFTGSFIGLVNLGGGNLSPLTLNIILPIGLSFHTFQSLSYVIEVYRGHQKAERDFVVYSTYVMFFPQLVAGPIERPQNLLHQFREHHDFDYDAAVSGLKRMAWGFFKKLVVADRLALYVNDVYGAPHHFNGLQLCIATIFFAYQIYCDFSGYSDIAIGSARVLGFRLMENFNTPYYSKSVSEFWRRWHISLSSWFRDYVFFPLGGSRVGKLAWIRNVLVTFGISGLWHGANWTFVVWGLLNGLYLIVGASTEEFRNRIFRAVGVGDTSATRLLIRVGCTFLLTLVAWVFFRAANFGDAMYVLTHFWRDWDFGSIRTEQFLMRQMPAAIGGILIVELVQLLNGRIRLATLLDQRPMILRWSVYVGFVFAVIMFGVFRNAQFIYFQF